MSGKQVTVDDRVFEELRRKVRAVGQAYVKVGVLQSGQASVTADGTDITLAELLAIHEYGAPKAGIPARMPLRRTFQEQEGADALRAFLFKVAKGLIAERLEVKQALEMLGSFAVARIKARIKAHLPPPLKPETVKRKLTTGQAGGSTPLVATSQLINSITSEVKE